MRGKSLFAVQKPSEYFNVLLKKRFCIVNDVLTTILLPSTLPPRFSVGGGFAAAWPHRFFVICHSGGRGTTSTMAEVCPVVPHGLKNAVAGSEKVQYIPR